MIVLSTLAYARVRAVAVFLNNQSGDAGPGIDDVLHLDNHPITIFTD
ncbi:MAG: hypothetical protein IMW89_16525 [Ktedonobacteraceae bacterium]|nr:hypothetical protein [Ktedonobacteraceae bacterium]